MASVRRIAPVQIITGSREEIQSAMNLIVNSFNREIETLENSVKGQLLRSPAGLPVGALWNDSGVIRQVVRET